MSDEMIRRIITAEVREVRDRVLEFTGSDETQDRMDEVIRAEGWQLKNYKKNPVFQWVHDYHLPPIGKSIKTWVDKETKELKFHIEFADPDLEYPANMPSPELVYRLYKAGILRAVSVGFIPLEKEMGEGADEEWGVPSKKPRRIYLKQDLLELSAVPVPANPNALVNAEESELVTAKEVEALNDWIHRTEIEAGVRSQYPDLPEEKISAMVTGIFEGGKMAEADFDAEGKPYPNEHACRLRDPDDFQDGSFRRTKREHEGRQYSVIMGKLEGEDTMTDQAFRYKKDKWPVADARKHCKDHDGSFEAAAESSYSQVSQLAICDEFDYILGCLRGAGLSPESAEAGWDVVRQIMRQTGDDIPDDIVERIGAVLSKKNLAKLTDIQRLAQEVIDSAAKPEEEDEGKEIGQEEEKWTPEDTKEILELAKRRLTGKID